MFWSTFAYFRLHTGDPILFYMGVAFMNGRYTVLICVFVLSCSSAEEEASFGDFLFLDKAEEQETGERIWKDVSVSKIFELPGDEEIMLYNPQYIIPDTNGDMYVVDYSAYQIFRYDSDGNYIMTYGSGVGNAPGEFVSISSVQVLSDSLIYVTDPNNLRISSFSKVTGKFVDSRVFDRQEVPFGRAVTNTDIEYILRAYNTLSFESNFRGKSVQFGELIEGDDLFVSTMLASGMIETYKDWMIYVPFHFPVIMVYDVNGNLVRTKKTMSIDRFEAPQLVLDVTNGIESYQLEGDFENALLISVVGNELFLQFRSDSEDPENLTVIVDVYEAGSLKYKSSFRLDSPSFIAKDRIYQPTRDATVVVSSINRPS